MFFPLKEELRGGGGGIEKNLGVINPTVVQKNQQRCIVRDKKVIYSA